MAESTEKKMLPSGYNWGLIAGFTVGIASVALTLFFVSLGAYNEFQNYLERERIKNYSSPIIAEADQKASEAYDSHIGPYKRLSSDDSIKALVERPADQQAVPVTEADLEAAKAEKTE